MTDMRFLINSNGKTTLQFRIGTPETVGNPKHDRYSDNPNTGKYTTKINWGKWKDVRTENQLTMQNMPKLLEQE